MAKFVKSEEVKVGDVVWNDGYRWEVAKVQHELDSAAFKVNGVDSPIPYECRTLKVLSGLLMVVQE